MSNNIEEKTSTWGQGEEITINTLQKEEIKGKWLDLAAGDGRYVPELLEKVDKLILSDIDANELDKIQKKLSEEQKSKTNTKIFDMTKKFPFEDNTFDGIFCTGTLHLFTKDKLSFIFPEIERILKSRGKLIIDFATDIKRVLSSGKTELLKNRPEYTLEYEKNEVKELLKDKLKEYDLKIEESIFGDDLTNVPEYGFKTKGNFFLVVAVKKK